MATTKNTKSAKKCKVPERVSEQRKAVVEAIVKSLEEGGFKWTQEWFATASPRNAVNGNVYRGGNRIHLSFIAWERGYKDPRWCTYKQAEERGWKVKKGAKSAIVEKWKMMSFAKERENATTGERETYFVTFPKCIGYWSVFNAEDIEGIPEYVPDMPIRDINEFASETADAFIVSSRCKVIEGTADPFHANEACYVPARDVLYVPARDSFTGDVAFLRTLLHEMVHSTCVPLERDARNPFGSVEYAFEELIAELGAMFTASDAGFPCLPAPDKGDKFYENHVAYLASWSRALKDDPDALFRAASAASAAADYLMKRVGGADGSHEGDGGASHALDGGKAGKAA